MTTTTVRSFCLIIIGIFVTALAGCGSVAPRGSPAEIGKGTPSVSRSGGYYLNDGPGDNPPAHLDQVPDAVPKVEPLKSGAMRPYTVLGQTYTPMTALGPYRKRGVASWYGRRYHGQKTASGELYDMYAMTAAHPTLPIPSYARVTNLANGKSVVVRINDRGPFLSDRLIDLSYTAAYKLGVLGGGKTLVEVDSIFPDAGTPLHTNVAEKSAPVPAAPVLAPIETADAEELADMPTGQAPPTAVPEVPAAPTSVVTITTEPKGVFLQLGAFGSRDNAESYLTKMQAQLDDTLAPSLHIYQKGGLFRVHAGPYANEMEARQAADHLNQSLGIRAMVVTR